LLGKYNSLPKVLLQCPSLPGTWVIEWVTTDFLPFLRYAAFLFLFQGSGGEAGEEAVEGTSGVSDPASFAVIKLRELNEKLEYKRQALSSIQNAPKPDKKVTVLLSRLSLKVSLRYSFNLC
jgi:hypothetical protein